MTVKLITVEKCSEPEFIDCICATKRNVLAAQEWLSAEIEEASRHYGFGVTEAILKKLFDPPQSVQDFSLMKQFSGGAAAEPGVIDGSGAALLAFSQGRSAETTWQELSKEERRNATAMGKWWFSSNRNERRGAPIDTDIPLLLYLMFVIEEIIGRRLPRSRPFTESKNSARGAKRPPSGPAFMLLRAAYAQASVRADVMPSSSETVYHVVRIGRRDTFRQQITKLKWHVLSMKSGQAESTLSQIVEARPYECRRLFLEASRRASSKRTD